MAALLGAGGCRTRIGGGDAAEAANLAMRVTELEREVQVQTLRANEAEAKMRAMPSADADVLLATPALAAIEIDRLSGPSRSDVAGFPVFVRALDGRGRFLQVVGRLEVEVFVEEGAAGGAGAERVGGATLGPLEVREAYRSGITGTHYRVEILASDAFVRSPAYRGALARYTLRIVARFDDARTGQRVEATTIIPARGVPAGT